MNRRMYNLNKTLNTKSLCKKHMHDNVVNLSSYTPTQTELDILSKGLSFIPYTRCLDRDITEETESFIRKLRLRYIHRFILTKPNPFRLKSTQTPKPTDCQDLENLINRIRLTMYQIHPTTWRLVQPPKKWYEHNQETVQRT